MVSERDPRLAYCTLHDAQFTRGLVCPHCEVPMSGEPDIRCDSSGCRRRATSLATLVPGHRRAAYCETHTRWAQARGEPTEPLSLPSPALPRANTIAALICAGIHGSPFSPVMLALLSDPEGAPVLHDLVEETWNTTAGWLLPVADRDWPERDDHGTGDNPHVWFPCKRLERRLSFERGITEIGVDDHRCTCGLYKSQHFEFHLDWHEHTIPATGAALTADIMREANRRLMERQTGLARDVLAEIEERYGWSRVAIEQTDDHLVLITAFRPCGHLERASLTAAALEDSAHPADLIMRALHDLGERGPMCPCGRATESPDVIAARQRALNYGARGGRSGVVSAELARRATAGERVAYVTPRGQRVITCAAGGLSWADAETREPGCTVAFAEQTAGETWMPVLCVRNGPESTSRGELWADDVDCVDRTDRIGRDACRCMEWRGRRWVNRIDPARIRAAEERYERRMSTVDSKST